MREIALAMYNTRTIQQVRSHAQKYFDKVEKYIEDARRTTNSILEAGRPQLEAAIRELETAYKSEEQRELGGKLPPAGTASNYSNYVYEQTLGRPLRYIDFMISYGILDQMILLPLVCVNDAMRVLRRQFPEMQFGGYQQSGTDSAAKLRNAIAGRYTPEQQEAIMISVVYNSADDNPIGGPSPYTRHGAPTVPSDGQSAETPRLNVKAFIRYCSAFLSCKLIHPGSARKILLSVTASISYIMPIMDPFDHSVRCVASLVDMNVDEVCCTLFCWYCCYVYKKSNDWVDNI